MIVQVVEIRHGHRAHGASWAIDAYFDAVTSLVVFGVPVALERTRDATQPDLRLRLDRLEVGGNPSARIRRMGPSRPLGCPTRRVLGEARCSLIVSGTPAPDRSGENERTAPENEPFLQRLALKTGLVGGRRPSAQAAPRRTRRPMAIGERMPEPSRSTPVDSARPKGRTPSTADTKPSILAS